MSVKRVLKHLSGQTHQEGFSSHQPFASLMLKSCHFHENTSPSQKCIQSLYEPREVHALYGAYLYHRTGLWFCCNLIYFFADILKTYESIIPLSQLETTSYWEHFLLLSARKAKAEWIFTATAGMLLPRAGSCSFQKLLLLLVAAIFLFRVHSNFFIKDFLSF